MTGNWLRLAVGSVLGLLAGSVYIWVEYERGRGTIHGISILAGSAFLGLLIAGLL